MALQKHSMRFGAVGPDTLVTIVLLLLSVIVGMRYGVRWGAAWGIFGSIGGGIVGFIAGVAFTVFVRFLASLISPPFEAFRRWWRPYPPPCEHGTCTNLGQYHVERLRDEFHENRPDLSSIGWRCRCGGLYAGVGATRWVRVLSEGTLEPYLVHRPFGRWRRDPAEQLPPYRPIYDPAFFGTLGAVSLIVGAAALLLTKLVSLGALQTIGAVGIMTGVALLLLAGIDHLFRRRQSAQAASELALTEQTRTPDTKETEEEGYIPGWTIPLITTLLTGGTAFFVMWFETGLRDATSRWLVAGCTALGLILGTAAWLGRAWRGKRIARAGRDPVELLWFVGLKLISLVPGAVAVTAWIAPLADQSLFDRVIVTLITGGLFLLGFFAGGLSFSRQDPDDPTTLDKCCRVLAALGLGFAVVGFALGFIAAP